MYRVYKEENSVRLTEASLTKLKEYIKADSIEVETDNYPHGDYVSSMELFFTCAGKGFGVFVTQTPANCGSVILYGINFDSMPSEKSEELLSQVLEYLKKQCGYSSAMYTTSEYQDGVASLLRACGFKAVKTFLNTRSGNNCKYWIKEL